MEVKNVPIYKFDFFFSKYDYLTIKGKGLSVFRSDSKFVQSFKDELEGRKIDFNYYETESFEHNDKIDCNKVTLIFQNLPFDEFILKADLIADKLIFPLWFNKAPICFFSEIDKASYTSEKLVSSEIHYNYQKIINNLFSEQIIALLDTVNYQFISPKMLEFNEDKIFYTPIEQLMRNSLEEAGLEYKPQAKIGRRYADFIVQNEAGEVIVECDGKAFHEEEKDRARDKELFLEGLPILHFTGSQIFNDISCCIDLIKKTSTQSQNYLIDPDLDESQKASVSEINGPIRVLAPAGSGKTKTLTNRVVNLINSGIPENTILALAFNKKAAAEMENRLFDKGIKNIEVRTFHSFDYQIVKNTLGWIFNTENLDQKKRKILANALKNCNIELPKKRNFDPLDQFLHALSVVKNELPALNSYEKLEIQNSKYEEIKIDFEPIFNEFIKLQIANNFLTYDDMIYFANKILLNDKALRKHYQNLYQYLLVDEFQDLNKSQLLMIQILTLPQNNLYIVGDDDQMIFGFRGAEIRNIMDFHKRYNISFDHPLSTNYRSSKSIVEHSKWLINHNIDRVKKDIKATGDATEGIFEVSIKEDLSVEAKSVAYWIKRLHDNNNFKWRDFAVLSRFKSYQYIIAIALDELKIPHSPVSNNRLFKTKVGRDVFAYLTLILEPEQIDKTQIKRILTRPNKYLTNQALEKIVDWATLKRSPGLEGLSDKEKKNLSDFLGIIKELQSVAKNPKCTPHSLLTDLEVEIGLLNFYKDQTNLTRKLDEESEDILFEIMLSVAKHYDSLKIFYDYLKDIFVNETDEALNYQDEEENKNQVTVATIHKTKGKEYRNVAYFHLVEDRALRGDEIEEERRVCYVGATRAIENLLVTSLRNKESRFLKELTLNPKFKDVKSIEELKQTIEAQSQELVNYKNQAKQENENILRDIEAFQIQMIPFNNKIEALERKKEVLKNKFPELDQKSNAKAKTNGLIGIIRRSRLNNAIFRFRITKFNEKTKKILGEKIKPIKEEINNLREKELKIQNEIELKTEEFKLNKSHINEEISYRLALNKPA